MIVTQRRRDDLRRACAVAVDEHDERRTGGHPLRRSVHAARLVRAREGNDNRVVEEERRHRNRLVEQAARVLAKVEDKAVRALVLQPLELAPEYDRRADPERRQTQNAPALPGVRDEPSLHNRRVHDLATHAEVEPVHAALNRETNDGPPRPEDAREPLRHREVRRGRPVDADDRVADPHAGVLSRARPQRNDEEPVHRRQQAHPYPGVARGRLLADELVRRRCEVLGIRIAER